MPDRKLLLADDSVTIQKVINLTFADEGIEVMAVGDGDTAMERFYDFRPDIVLADVNMPGMNGYRICENLRQREDTANIPVILLVGSFESFDENEARRVGANDWMTKPFQSIRQLVSKVTNLLDHPTDSNIEPLAVPTSDFGETPLSLETQPLSEPTKENEDIDDLYNQSIAKTVELPQSFRSDLVLGDTGMDDDMIETSYIGAVDHKEESREFKLSPVGESYGFAANPPDVSPDPFDMNDQSVADSDTLPALEFQPFDIEDGPGVVETREPELFLDPGCEPTDHEKGFDIESEREPEIVAAPVDVFHEATPPTDDADLLEIPLGGDRSQPRHPEEDIVTLDDQSPSVSMSPEFIDAVARKVIEKISENVVRQIAWQVVPQVADSVIREKIEEKSNN